MTTMWFSYGLRVFVYNNCNVIFFCMFSQSSHASFSALDRIGLHERAPPTKDYSRERAGSRGEGGASYMPYAKSHSRESYGSRDSKEGFSQDTQVRITMSKLGKGISKVKSSRQ